MKEIGNFIFISAALYDPETGAKFTGNRHHEIILMLANEGYPSKIIRRCKQGFIVKHCDYMHDEFFMSRDDATELAKDNDYSMIGPVLTSEDLW